MVVVAGLVPYVEVPDVAVLVVDGLVVAVPEVAVLVVVGLVVDDREVEVVVEGLEVDVVDLVDLVVEVEGALILAPEDPEIFSVDILGLVEDADTPKLFVRIIHEFKRNKDSNSGAGNLSLL
ncbi:MAG: hypothetical protein Q9P44_11560 [Anaerolineae bacterium]|nr:hypothetical protein [Anaerolineae bacterium]